MTHPPHSPLAPSVFTCAGGGGFLDIPTPSGVLSLPLDGAGGAESCSGEHSGVGDSKCLSGVCISHLSNGGRLRPGSRASGSKCLVSTSAYAPVREAGGEPPLVLPQHQLPPVPGGPPAFSVPTVRPSAPTPALEVQSEGTDLGPDCPVGSRAR